MPTFDELFNHEYWNKLGYTPGLGRDVPNPKKSHLYRGRFDNLGQPMCHNGWNRDEGRGYSIWRNNIGECGICITCIKNAKKEMKNGIVIDHVHKNARASDSGVHFTPTNL